MKRKKHCFSRFLAFILAVLIGMSDISSMNMAVYAADESGASMETISGNWTDDENCSTELKGADGASGELGSDSNPYLITSAADLGWLAVNCSTTSAAKDYSGKYFKIVPADGTKTIDLSANYWTPIADFYGHLDGNGVTISGLKIGSKENVYETVGNVGLFGTISGGSITNLSVAVEIYTNGDTSKNSGSVRHIVGGIAGLCTTATLDGCKVTGSITSSAGDHQQLRVGGVVGTAQNGAVVANCINEATVKASSNSVNTFVGGIAGYVQQNTSKTYVINCCNLGSVSADAGGSKSAYAGGIVAAAATNSGNTATNIYLLNCYNIGDISASGKSVFEGSIAGQAMYTNLEHLYWLENTATTIFGNKYLAENAYNSVGNAVNTSGVTNENLSSVIDALNGNKDTVAKPDGLTLQEWTIAENGRPTLAGTTIDEGSGGEDSGDEGVGGEGSDDEGAGGATTDTLWITHAAENIAEGEGTAESPYIIKTAEELALLAKDPDTYINAYIKLVAEDGNIDLSAYEWRPISTFSGYLDGNGVTIKGLKIGSAECPYGTIGNVGLFGALNNATIKDLTIEVAIYTVGDTSKESGNKRHIVGGIAGECSEANVDKCKVTGIISTTASGYQQLRIGGVVGFLTKGGVVTNCISEVNVSANGIGVNVFAGGIVGYMQDVDVNTYVVNNCNMGSVTSVASSGKEAYAGGIVASVANSHGTETNQNFLLNCYNIGAVNASATKTYAGSIAGQVGGCVLAYLYGLEGSAAAVFGKSSNVTAGNESSRTVNAEYIKSTDFLTGLNINASKLNEEDEKNNAHKWVTDVTSGYAVPGDVKATDKTLDVTVNSALMGSVTIEIKAPGSESFTRAAMGSMVENNSTVRLTPNPVEGIRVANVTVDGEEIAMAEGVTYYEFTLTQSTTVEILFEVEKIITAAPIYVDPDVTTSGDGTSAEAPFKTLTEAQTKLREILEQLPTAEVTVYLMGGTYVLDEILTLNEEDASLGRVTFINYENETPVITSGHQIPAGSFDKVEGKEYYAYQIQIEAGESYPIFRDLLVNGERATLAKTKEYTYMKNFKGAVVEGSKVTACENGLYVSKEALASITNQNLDGLELGQLIEWKSQILHVGTIVGEDTESGEIEINIKADEWELYYTTDSTKRVLNDRTYWLQNHISFLDEPGEFYYDQQAGIVYYYPYADEDMNTVVIEYATQDTLIQLQNTANITFDGITFTGTTANYITNNGLATQLGCTIYTLEDTTGTGDNVPIAAIRGDMLEGIRVQNCIFTELGGSAIVFNLGIKDLQVTGNVIKDIAMAGIMVGKNQAEWNKDGILGSSENVTISNNYITNIGLVVAGAPGIKVCRSENLRIRNNTIVHVPYSGIMAGYGWILRDPALITEAWIKNLVNTDISYNYVEDYLYQINDGGAIYTCGPNGFAADTSHGNAIHHNYIRAGAHNETYTGVYHDGAASNWHTYSNVIDDLVSKKGPMFFQDDVEKQYTHSILAENNYTTVSKIIQSGNTDMFGNARNIELKNNVVLADRSELRANTEAHAIINAAGLEAGYEHIATPMDVELRISDDTMHYVVDSSKETNTVARIELTNNSDKDKIFTLSLTDALPSYVSCQFTNDGVVTLKAGETAIVEAEFIITDKKLFSDTDDYVVGFQVADEAGRKTLYPRTFTVSCFTGANRIAYGTPKLDGVMDDAYMKSTNIQVGDIFNMYSYDVNLTLTKHDLTEANSDVTGFGRLLWDENYLYCYIYVEEKDSTVASRGMTYINDMINNSPSGLWRNDGIELYINTPAGGKKMTKYAVDAFGIQRYGTEELSVHNELPYATAFTYNGEIVEGLEIKEPTANQSASTAEKPVNGYVIEMALPLTKCSDLAVEGTPQAGDKIRFQMQNNDMEYSAEQERIYIVSLHTIEKEYLLVKEEVITPTPTPTPTPTAAPTSEPTEAPTATPTTSPAPEFDTVEILLEETDKSYALGTNGNVSIHCTGELDELENVEMDGEIVEESNYTTKEGSTIVTFKAAYLETLSVGGHTVTLNYSGGRSIDTTLSILAKAVVDDGASDDSNNSFADDSNDDNSNTTADDDNSNAGAASVSATETPSTGDSSNAGLWLIVCMLACVVIAGILSKKAYK